jgi:hypothetical protein
VAPEPTQQQAGAQAIVHETGEINYLKSHFDVFIAKGRSWWLLGAWCALPADGAIFEGVAGEVTA